MKCKRLRVKIAAVLLILGLLLQGCSGSTTKLATTDELVICIDEHFYPEMKSIFRDYTDTYPNVKITYEIVTRDNSIFAPLIDEDYKHTTLKHLKTEIMSGSGPDLFILDSGYNGECFFQDINKAMRGGVFCDLLPLFRETGISEEDFIRPVFEAGKVDGKQYVAPLEYQVYTILTTEESHFVLGADTISNTADMMAGIGSVMEMSGAGVPPSRYTFGVFDSFINPYYYAAKTFISYDKNTVQIDSKLTRTVLETGKFAIDKLKQYESSYEPENWYSYVHSNRYVAFSPYFFATVFWSTGPSFFDAITRLNPIPSEDGGVCAVISSFAGIRANSVNKQNAINMIKLLLSEKYQIGKNGLRNVYPCEGYPVRKGVLEQRIHDLVPGGETLFSTFGSQDWAVITNETLLDFLSIESQITTARFPTPHEVNDIMDQYYTGEIDLDSALLMMQEYWEISLSE